eukprot:gene47182-58883_t
MCLEEHVCFVGLEPVWLRSGGYTTWTPAVRCAQSALHRAYRQMLTSSGHSSSPSSLYFVYVDEVLVDVRTKDLLSCVVLYENRIKAGTRPAVGKKLSVAMAFVAAELEERSSVRGALSSRLGGQASLEAHGLMADGFTIRDLRALTAYSALHAMDDSLRFKTGTDEYQAFGQSAVTWEHNIPTGSQLAVDVVSNASLSGSVAADNEEVVSDREEVARLLEDVLVGLSDEDIGATVLNKNGVEVSSGSLRDRVMLEVETSDSRGSASLCVDSAHLVSNCEVAVSGLGKLITWDGPEQNTKPAMESMCDVKLSALTLSDAVAECYKRDLEQQIAAYEVQREVERQQREEKKLAKQQTARHAREARLLAIANRNDAAAAETSSSSSTVQTEDDDTLFSLGDITRRSLRRFLRHAGGSVHSDVIDEIMSDLQAGNRGASEADEDQYSHLVSRPETMHEDVQALLSAQEAAPVLLSDVEREQWHGAVVLNVPTGEIGRVVYFQSGWNVVRTLQGIIRSRPYQLEVLSVDCDAYLNFEDAEILLIDAEAAEFDPDAAEPPQSAIGDSAISAVPLYGDSGLARPEDDLDLLMRFDEHGDCEEESPGAEGTDTAPMSDFCPDVFFGEQHIIDNEGYGSDTDYGDDCLSLDGHSLDGVDKSPERVPLAGGVHSQQEESPAAEQDISDQLVERTKASSDRVAADPKPARIKYIETLPANIAQNIRQNSLAKKAQQNGSASQFGGVRPAVLTMRPRQYISFNSSDSSATNRSTVLDRKSVVSTKVDPARKPTVLSFINVERANHENSSSISNAPSKTASDVKHVSPAVVPTLSSEDGSGDSSSEKHQSAKNHSNASEPNQNRNVSSSITNSNSTSSHALDKIPPASGVSQRFDDSGHRQRSPPAARHRRDTSRDRREGQSDGFNERSQSSNDRQRGHSNMISNEHDKSRSTDSNKAKESDSRAVFASAASGGPLWKGSREADQKTPPASSSSATRTRIIVTEDGERIEVIDRTAEEEEEEAEGRREKRSVHKEANRTEKPTFPSKAESDGQLQQQRPSVPPVALVQQSNSAPVTRPHQQHVQQQQLPQNSHQIPPQVVKSEEHRSRPLKTLPPVIKRIDYNRPLPVRRTAVSRPLPQTALKHTPQSTQVPAVHASTPALVRNAPSGKPQSISTTATTIRKKMSVMDADFNLVEIEVQDDEEEVVTDNISARVATTSSSSSAKKVEKTVEVDEDIASLLRDIESASRQASQGGGGGGGGGYEGEKLTSDLSVARYSPEVTHDWDQDAHSQYSSEAAHIPPRQSAGAAGAAAAIVVTNIISQDEDEEELFRRYETQQRYQQELLKRYGSTSAPPVQLSAGGNGASVSQDGPRMGRKSRFDAPPEKVQSFASTWSRPSRFEPLASSSSATSTAMRGSNSNSGRISNTSHHQVIDLTDSDNFQAADNGHQPAQRQQQQQHGQQQHEEHSVRRIQNQQPNEQPPHRRSRFAPQTNSRNIGEVETDNSHTSRNHQTVNGDNLFINRGSLGSQSNHEEMCHGSQLSQPGRSTLDEAGVMEDKAQRRKQRKLERQAQIEEETRRLERDLDGFQVLEEPVDDAWVQESAILLAEAEAAAQKRRADAEAVALEAQKLKDVRAAERLKRLREQQEEGEEIEEVSSGDDEQAGESGRVMSVPDTGRAKKRGKRHRRKGDCAQVGAALNGFSEQFEEMQPVFGGHFGLDWNHETSNSYENNISFQPAILPANFLQHQQQPQFEHNPSQFHHHTFQQQHLNLGGFPFNQNVMPSFQYQHQHQQHPGFDPDAAHEAVPAGWREVGQFDHHQQQPDASHQRGFRASRFQRN